MNQLRSQEYEDMGTNVDIEVDTVASAVQASRQASYYVRNMTALVSSGDNVRGVVSRSREWA